MKRHDGFRPTLLAVIRGENVWNASVHIIATTATSSKTIVRRLVVTRFIGKRLFHGSDMNLFSVTSGELEVLGLPYWMEGGIFDCRESLEATKIMYCAQHK